MAGAPTKLQLISGTVYTKLSPEEVRVYMQGGVKANVIEAYLDMACTQRVWLAAGAIEYIFL